MVRFPLRMADGAQVRTLDELREHFNLETVLEYYKNGKLLTWLQDRYLETEAAAIQALDERAEDLPAELCKIFNVEYNANSIDVQKILQRPERLKRLLSFTENKEIIDLVDQVAFDDEDIAKLLDIQESRIYLLGDRFNIPVSKTGISYIGLNHPTVHIAGVLPSGKDLMDLNIRVSGCRIENPSEQELRTIPDLLEKSYQKLALLDSDPILVEFRSAGSSDWQSKVHGTKAEIGPLIQGEVQNWASRCNSDTLILSVSSYYDRAVPQAGDKSLNAPPELTGSHGTVKSSPVIFPATESRRIFHPFRDMLPQYNSNKNIDCFRVPMMQGGSGNMPATQLQKKCRFRISSNLNCESAEGEVSKIDMTYGENMLRFMQVHLSAPVLLAGREYSCFPIFTVSLFESLALRKGSRIKIFLVADTVPAITVLDAGSGEKYSIFEQCSFCNKPLVKQDGRLYCNNWGCAPNKVDRIAQFLPKIGLNGYSIQFLDVFMKKLHCSDLAGILRVSESDFKRYRINDPDLHSFLENLRQTITQRSDLQILDALLSPYVTPIMERLIIRKFGFLGLSKLSSWQISEFLDMPQNKFDVCPSAKKFLENYFESTEFKNTISALAQYITITSNFEGLVTVGHNSEKASSRLRSTCKKCGFTLTDWGNFDVLVTYRKDAENGSDKMNYAHKNNLPIFIEKDFCEYF